MTIASITTTPDDRAVSGFPKIPTRIQADPDGMQMQVLPEVLDRLHVLEGDLASVHRVCCEAYCSQGKYEEALVHQRMAVAMDPDEVEYRNQLGFLRYLTGDDDAAEDFEFVIRKDPTNPEGWFNLAMLRFGQHNFAEAERGFLKAAELNPNDAEIWNNLGVARFQNGGAADARVCFENAVRIDPEHADARANLSDLSG